VNDTLFLHFKSGTKPLANAWFGLAIMALGIAALLAIVLVAARVPFLGLGGGIFRTALVLHVVFGVVVWFLAFAAGSWSLLSDKARPIGWLPLVVAVAGIACLLFSPVVGFPPPVLANYVPVLDSPLFLIGLFGFLLAVTLSGVLALASGFKSVAIAGMAPIVIATRWAILVAMLAAIVFCIDFYRANSSSVVLPVTLDDKLWGTGHLMQFVHSLLMMAAWLWVLGVSGPVAAVVILSGAVPTGSGAYVLARQMRGDAPLVANILTLQVICAAFTIPLIMTLLAA
jgi:predicted permease